MTIAPITSATAALAAVALVGLSAPISAQRFRAKVSLGHGADKALECRIRTQANFVEYTPLILIVMGLAEANGAPATAMWALAAALVLGRAAHAFGMLGGPLRARQLGILLTWLALLGGAGVLAWRLI